MPDKNKESHVYHHTSDDSPAPGVKAGKDTSSPGLKTGLIHEIPVWGWWAVALGTVVVIFWKLHSKSSSSGTTETTPNPVSGTTTADQTSTGNVEAANAPIIINAEIQDPFAQQEMSALNREIALLQELLNQNARIHIPSHLHPPPTMPLPDNPPMVPPPAINTHLDPTYPYPSSWFEGWKTGESNFDIYPIHGPSDHRRGSNYPLYPVIPGGIGFRPPPPSPMPVHGVPGGIAVNPPPNASTNPYGVPGGIGFRRRN